MSDPRWLTNPDDPLAPKSMTRDIHDLVMMEQMAQIMGHAPEDQEIEEFMLEAGQNPEFLAIVESETIHRTARVMDIASHSVEAQAVMAAQSGMHAYHPQHFGSAVEMLQDALQETEYGTSKFYNLRTIVEVIVPYCMTHDIPVPENLIADGNDTKARYLADYMGPRLKDKDADPELLSRDLEKFLSEVIDPEISVSKLKEDFPSTTASGIEPVDAYNYVMRRGGYLVIHYDSEPQLSLVERSLGKKAEWHFGTGTEPFLQQLIARKKVG